MRRDRVRVLASAAACVFVLPLAGCGSGRSPQAFCEVYWKQKHDYLEHYATVQQQTNRVGRDSAVLGVFAGLAQSIAAVGDVEVIFDKLDQVAPDDIEADVARIRDSLKAETDSAGGAYKDPIGTIAGGLVRSFTTMGSWRRVSNYVVQQCGEKGTVQH